jgi:rubredoxin
MTTETGERPRCVDCGLTFDSEAALMQHRQDANHPGLGMEEKHECRQCGFVMETEDDLRKHMEMMHSGSR